MNLRGRGEPEQRDGARLAAWVEACRGRRVAVVGDIMLDRYVHGAATRISPEAPVPVVEYAGESLFPGGAANVAANIASLGGVPLLAGIVGRDGTAQALRETLDAAGIGSRLLVASADRPTTEKVRVVAGRQQLLRLDREDRGAVSAEVRRAAAHAAERAVARAAAVVIEDYGKGMIVPGLLRAVCRAARSRGIPVVFDPKEDHRVKLPWVTVATPNRHETFRLAGIPESPAVDPVVGDRNLRRAARALLDGWGCGHLLVTLGERGMCLFPAAGRPLHIPAATREVYDVSGAGDTVAAVIALGLAAGAPMEDACALANHAAGVVVGRSGTATASPQDVLDALAR